MNYWYSLNLGDAMFSFEPAEKIALAIKAWQASQVDNLLALTCAAVFTRNDSEGRLHCQTIAFFSPDTAAVALQFGAHPCPRPPRDGLDLLTEDPAAWSLLFPENR